MVTNDWCINGAVTDEKFGVPVFPVVVCSVSYKIEMVVMIGTRILCPFQQYLPVPIA